MLYYIKVGPLLGGEHRPAGAEVQDAPVREGPRQTNKQTNKQTKKHKQLIKQQTTTNTTKQLAMFNWCVKDRAPSFWSPFRNEWEGRGGGGRASNVQLHTCTLFAQTGSYPNNDKNTLEPGSDSTANASRAPGPAEVQAQEGAHPQDPGAAADPEVPEGVRALAGGTGSVRHPSVSSVLWQIQM